VLLNQRERLQAPPHPGDRCLDEGLR
jgi:hypothetical protein